jgi:hypothetical protein
MVLLPSNVVASQPTLIDCCVNVSWWSVVSWSQWRQLRQYLNGPITPNLTPWICCHLLLCHANATSNCYRATKGFWSTASIRIRSNPSRFESEDSKVRDHPAPEVDRWRPFDERERRWKALPMPDKDEPAVNSVKQALASDESESDPKQLWWHNTIWGNVIYHFWQEKHTKRLKNPSTSHHLSLSLAVDVNERPLRRSDGVEVGRGASGK